MTVKTIVRVIISAALMAAFISACNAKRSQESDVDRTRETRDLSYSFEENGCATGKVTYSDDSDYCAALKDDSRNNNCARRLRATMFETKKCPGSFYQK